MKIILTTGKSQIKEFIVDRNQVTIGRSNKCDICIPSDHISRKHLEVTIRNDEIFIKDLTLSNWVSYNDEKLQKDVETQYFDFAKLSLPGNLNFKIELDQEENSGFNYRDQLERTNTTTKVIPESDSFNEDIYHSPIGGDGELDPALRRKLNGGKDSDGETKFRKEIVLMMAVFLGICIYLFVFMPNSETVEDNSSLSQVQNNKPRVTRKIKRKPRPKQKKSIVTSKPKSKVQKEFESLYKNADSCNKGYTKRICLMTLKGKTKFEGAVLKGSTLHVFKNYRERTLNMFLKKRGYANNALKQSGMERVIAGEIILIPKIMEEMEGQKISKVKVHLFNLSGPEVKYRSTYRIDPSFFRRYDLDEYNRAYSSVRNNLDTSVFAREFTRFLSKEE
jgi:hypothetical protein